MQKNRKGNMKYFYQLLLILSIHFLVLGEDGLENQILNLPDFISAASQNSHFEEILAEELTLLYGEKLKISPGNFILDISSEYSFKYDDTFFHGLGGSIQLSKLFSYTGTTLTGNYSITPVLSTPVTAVIENSTTPNGINFNNNLSSKIQFTLEQAIVKNAFGRIYRVEKNIAGLESEVIRLQIIEAYEDYLASLIKIYVDWFTTYSNLENARQNLTEKNLLLKSIQNKQQYSIASAADVRKTELEVMSAEEKLIQYEHDFIIQTYSIRQLIGKPEHLTNFIPSLDLKFVEVGDMEEAYHHFTQASRLVKIFKLNNQADELNQKILINHLLPEVALETAYSFSGDDLDFKDNLTHEFSAGINASFNIPQPGWLYSLKESKQNLENEKLSQKNDLLQYEDDFFQLYQNLVYEQKMVTSMDKKLNLSNQVVEDEEKSYNQGNSTLNNLLSTYNSRSTYRINQVIHGANYFNYYINWLKLNDLLINNEKQVPEELKK
ncbi:MAG: TolC family protein [Spirochaetes bacterium]|nr:TolC family protein [Spirochaetota bacterium]